MIKSCKFTKIFPTRQARTAWLAQLFNLGWEERIKRWKWGTDGIFFTVSIPPLWWDDPIWKNMKIVHIMDKGAPLAVGVLIIG